MESKRILSFRVKRPKIQSLLLLVLGSFPHFKERWFQKQIMVLGGFYHGWSRILQRLLLYITTYDLWNFCTDGLPHGENQGIWIYHPNWPGQSSEYVSIWSVRNFAPINSWFFLCCPLELPPGPQDAGSSPPGWDVDPPGTNDADPMVIDSDRLWLNPCYFWGVTPRGSRATALERCPWPLPQLLSPSFRGAKPKIQPQVEAKVEPLEEIKEEVRRMRANVNLNKRR